MPNITVVMAQKTIDDFEHECKMLKKKRLELLGEIDIIDSTIINHRAIISGLKTFLHMVKEKEEKNGPPSL